MNTTDQFTIKSVYTSAKSARTFIAFYIRKNKKSTFNASHQFSENTHTQKKKLLTALLYCNEWDNNASIYVYIEFNSFSSYINEFHNIILKQALKL